MMGLAGQRAARTPGGLLPAVVCLTLCAACSSTTNSSSPSNGVSAAASRASTRAAPTPHHRHATAHPPGPRRRPRRRPAPRPASLPIGSASSTAIQPQSPAGSCHARGWGDFSRPDPRCTPGAISPAVTQANLQSTICSDGYTETVRPSESVTEPEKEASIAAYGDAGRLHDYEYDHLVPLELGGAGNDPRNLWPEPGASPNRKDELEDRLRSMVCSGEIDLAAAQHEIASDWVAAYHRLVG